MKWTLTVDTAKYVDLNDVLNDMKEECDVFAFILSVGEKRQLTKHVILERVE